MLAIEIVVVAVSTRASRYTRLTLSFITSLALGARCYLVDKSSQKNLVTRLSTNSIW
jgi:hypothetical protein